MTAPRPRKTYRADRRNTAREILGAPWAHRWPAAQRLIAAEVRAEQREPGPEDRASYFNPYRKKV